LPWAREFWTLYQFQSSFQGTHLSDEISRFEPFANRLSCLTTDVLPSCPMIVEWLIVGLLLGLVLVTVGQRLRSRAAQGGLLLFYLSALSATFWWQHRILHTEKTRAAFQEKVPTQGRPGGYVSSDNCKACHPDQYASWHRSYHRTMTQLASPETVRGKFEGVSLQLEGDAYHLERRGEEFWVDMVDPDWRSAQPRGAASLPSSERPASHRAKKQITMLTGSHHMQAYWVASEHGNKQFSFPFTYLFEDERWVPRNDVFLFDPTLRFSHQVWNVGCISCHATAGQPRQDPKTKLSQTRTAELGIACEACHGPAGQHVEANSDPTRRYSLHQSGKSDPTIANPGRQNHIQSSEACGQCHAIRRNHRQEDWNLEGVAYRPGENLEARAPLIQYDGANLYAPGQERKRALMEGSFWSDGQVRVSGREFNGLVASGCFQRGELSCLSCHSLHHYQSNDDQLAPGMEGNRACLQCHADFSRKLEQHTHHRAGSSGSLCYNCHMPHTTYGLLKAIRSHTIDSPRVQTTLKSGRPNACNLCHLDQTLDWTSRKLHEWYSQPLEALNDEQKSTSAALQSLLKGDAGQRALLAWHFGWEPAKEISSASWMPPHLAQLLVDPYSAVRYITQRSLKRHPGYEHLSYDFIGPPLERAQARDRALEIWRATPTPVNHPGNSVLLQPNGLLQEGKVKSLLEQRDNRRMELLE
jgi:hypothetical protein